MSVLQEICERKKEHVAQRKAMISLSEMESRAQNAPAPLGFIKALKAHEHTAIIAEVKKASPSKGVIRENFDPVEIAKSYESAHAACLSVLTDEPYFQGHDDYFRRVRETVSLPMLRKDFMIEPYQIYESRAMGADCILLIMAALDVSQAKELYDLSKSLGMDVLTEIHDHTELERSLLFDPEMVGVNNRNLKTLEVSTQTSIDLSEHIPENTVKIAESGLSDKAVIEQLKTYGYDGFLIGESLMRQSDVETALRALL